MSTSKTSKTHNLSGAGTIGAVGFLLSDRGHLFLSRDPGRTNLGGEPVLRGWLGTTNNVSNDSYGVARVTRVSDADEFRARAYEVTQLSGAEEDAALEALGYPELAS